MGFAEDKVYSHILRNLRNFGTIRVASLADSLTCLTDADRDELHAREETRGSQATVYRFYQHLRCRQGWVPDLIQALRHNNAGHLADELQEVYDTWKYRPSAPAAAPSLPNNARAAASSSGAQTPQTPPPRPNPAPGAPLAEHPPLQPSTASTTSPDLEARAPVQESLPKKLLQQESPHPTPAGSTAHPGASDGHRGGGHLPPSSETSQGSVGTPGVSGVSVPPEQSRDWLSRRPVCVDNGCFGNANHLHRGAPGLALGRAVPSRDAGGTPSPEQTRNEPQEDSDVSTESLPRLGGAAGDVGQQPPNSPPKKQPVPSSERGEATGGVVDVRSPLLVQQQFDAEKKLKVLREHSGDGDTSTETTTLVPRGTSPSQGTSMKSPVQKKKLPLGSKTGSSHSVPTKEKVFPASPDPLLGTAEVGGSQGTAGRSPSQGRDSRSTWSLGSDTGRDVELSKPGVLVSLPQGSPEIPSSPSSTASTSLGLSSDPLLVSTDSSSSGVPLPREEEAAGARIQTHSIPSWGSSSVGTYEIHVDHHPSVQLEAGNDRVSSLGSSLDSDSSGGHGAATSSSQAKVPPGDSNGPSVPYVLPAVGIALISAVAFLVYSRLQK